MLLAEAKLGRPIEVVLRELYVDQGLMQREVAAELTSLTRRARPYDTSTISDWLARCDIDARSRGRGSIAQAGAAS